MILLTAPQIRAAVDAGKTVYVDSNYYQVVKDSKGQYLIKAQNGHCIGLTWGDGTTLNGYHFYTDEAQAPEPDPEKLECSVRQDLIDAGIFVPVGDSFIEKGTYQYRYNNEDFQVLVNGEWLNAESIDFTFEPTLAEDEQPEETPTDILFRYHEKNKDLFAIFPAHPGTNQYDYTCYSHIGQHSTCHHDYYRESRPAQPHEYAALKRELESMYGPLKVVKRITKKHDAQRRAECQR